MRMFAFDIETTDLKALMGRMLCASFYPVIPAEFHPPKKQKQIKPLTFSVLDKNLKGDTLLDDSKVCAAVRDFIHDNANCILTWNGKLFDIPFLNARLDYWGLPICRPQFHLDMMYYARGSGARIGSSKLVNVQKFFELDEEKTEMKWSDWQLASTGDKKAMKEVVHHCEQDVIVLEHVYWRLLPHVANVHR